MEPTCHLSVTSVGAEWKANYFADRPPRLSISLQNVPRGLTSVALRAHTCYVGEVPVIRSRGARIQRRHSDELPVRQMQVTYKKCMKKWCHVGVLRNLETGETILVRFQTKKIFKNWLQALPSPHQAALSRNSSTESASSSAPGTPSNGGALSVSAQVWEKPHDLKATLTIKDNVLSLTMLKDNPDGQPTVRWSPRAAGTRIRHILSLEPHFQRVVLNRDNRFHAVVSYGFHTGYYGVQRYVIEPVEHTTASGLPLHNSTNGTEPGVCPTYLSPVFEVLSCNRHPPRCPEKAAAAALVRSGATSAAAIAAATAKDAELARMAKSPAHAEQLQTGKPAPPHDQKPKTQRGQRRSYSPRVSLQLDMDGAMDHKLALACTPKDQRQRSRSRSRQSPCLGGDQLSPRSAASGRARRPSPHPPDFIVVGTAAPTTAVPPQDSQTQTSPSCTRRQRRSWDELQWESEKPIMSGELAMQQQQQHELEARLARERELDEVVAAFTKAAHGNDGVSDQFARLSFDGLDTSTSANLEGDVFASPRGRHRYERGSLDGSSPATQAKAKRSRRTCSLGGSLGGAFDEPTEQVGTMSADPDQWLDLASVQQDVDDALFKIEGNGPELLGQEPMAHPSANDLRPGGRVHTVKLKLEKDDDDWEEGNHQPDNSTILNYGALDTAAWFPAPQVQQQPRDVVPKGIHSHNQSFFCDPNAWMKNSQARHCCDSHCEAMFGLLVRRHHCRSCGKIFCASCCPKRDIPDISDKHSSRRERVCHQCHHNITSWVKASALARSTPAEYYLEADLNAGQQQRPYSMIGDFGLE